MQASAGQILPKVLMEFSADQRSAVHAKGFAATFLGDER
jgi:hypothetical protein